MEDEYEIEEIDESDMELYLSQLPDDHRFANVKCTGCDMCIIHDKHADRYYVRKVEHVGAPELDPLIEYRAEECPRCGTQEMRLLGNHLAPRWEKRILSMQTAQIGVPQNWRSEQLTLF